MILDKIRKRIPPKYKALWNLYVRRFSQYSDISYSQFGEDRILKSIFIHQKTGFYVDVGAFHPAYISNTHYFYLNGWRGINIDATSQSMDLFRILRKEDINLELAISDSSDECIFYESDFPPLNSLSKEVIESRVQGRFLNLKNEKRVTPVPLCAVLDRYLPKNQTIDFFSIDAEGMDLNVLRSNNWDKYIPKAIVVESRQDFEVIDSNQDEIVNYLKTFDYKLICVTPANLIFTQNSYQIPR